MSKIVVVFSSPRPNGNSSALAEAVMDGAMGPSTNVIKVYRLNSMNYVRGCQNCDRCAKVPRCYIEDDIKPILDDIESCDSLVVAVPLYFNGPCGLFKILLDRLYSHMHGDFSPKYKGKKLVIILTHDDARYDERAKDIEDQLADIFSKNLGYDIIGIINYRCDRTYCAVGNDPEILERAKSLGQLL